MVFILLYVCLQEACNVIKSIDLHGQYRLKCSKFNKYFLDTWLCGNYPGDILAWTYFTAQLCVLTTVARDITAVSLEEFVISHLNIYEVITILKQEHANKAAFQVQLEAGHCPQKKRKLDKFVDQRMRECGLSYMLYVTEVMFFGLNLSNVVTYYTLMYLLM